MATFEEQAAYRRAAKERQQRIRGGQEPGYTGSAGDLISRDVTPSSGPLFPGEGWDIQDENGRPIDRFGNPIVNRALDTVDLEKWRRDRKSVV